MSQQQNKFDLSQLHGQVAVITGAGNYGIGWGLAKYAAIKLHMNVVLIDLHQATVDRTAAELRSLAPDREVLALACNVTKSEDLQRALTKIESSFTECGIGAVFANAGVIFNGSILRSEIEDWETTLNVNVLGVVRTIKAFLPRLQAQAQESIFCTTASVGGLVRGDGGAASYQASKHAVVALTESLSFEIAKKSPHVYVRVLCPCIVSTSLMQSSQINKSARHASDSPAITPIKPNEMPLGMTPERHAEQVFDLIADGKFYLVTDNVRPYVDHDLPFNAVEIITERFDNLKNLTLDNSDAFKPKTPGFPSSILKGPMFQEPLKQTID